MIENKSLGRNIPSIFLALVVAAAAPPPAVEAGTTGGIEGRAMDVDQDRPLAGVAVRLMSPVLPRGLATVTGRAGRFRFQGLPPGVYELEARREGYGTLEQTDIRVRLDHTVSLELEMFEAFGDEVILTGSAPVLDVTDTTTGTLFERGASERLPRGRSFTDLPLLAVEVLPGESLRLDLAGDPAVAGGQPAENRWLLDGLETTSTIFGTAAVHLPVEAVEQVEVKAGGAGVELGGGAGGVINAVTRSGGDALHGRLFAFLRDHGLEASSPATGVAGRDLGTTAWDAGGALGGPLVPPALGFFISAERGRLARWLSNRQGLRFEEDRSTVAWAGHLTWQPTDRQRFDLSLFGSPTDLAGVPRGDAAGRIADDGEQGARGGSLAYHGVVARNLFTELWGGRLEESFVARPDAEAPLYEDLTTTGRFGADAFWARREGCGDPDPLGRGVAFAVGCRGGTLVRPAGRGTREELRGVLRGLAGVGGGEHLLQMGAHWRWGKVYDDGRDPGAVPGIFRDSTGAVVDAGGLTGQRWVLDDRSARLIEIEGSAVRESDELALFVEDRIRLGDRAVVRLGLRAGSLAARLGRDGGLEDRLGFAFGDALAPRLGLVWDLRRNGRSRLYAFYGRSYDLSPPILDGQPFGARRRNLYTFAYPPGGALPTAADPGVLTERITLGRELGVDAELSPTELTEVRLGYQVEFLADITAGISLVRKDLDEVAEDVSLDGGETFWLTNPGGTYTRHPLTGQPLAEPVVLPRPRRRYEALELALHKGFGSGWQLHGSYVYTDSDGNYGAPFPSVGGALAPGVDTRFDLPGAMVGADGSLGTERRHRITAYGSYLWSSRLTTGVVVDLLSGAPISRLGAHPVLGRRQRFIGSRGDAGRTPTLWAIDVHLELPVELPGLTLHLLGDLFNLANQRRAVRVDEEWTFLELPRSVDPGEPQTNPGFGEPLELQQPRAMRLGVRLSW